MTTEKTEKTGMTVWYNSVNPYSVTGYQPIHLCLDKKIGEPLGYTDGQEVTKEQFDLLALLLTNNPEIGQEVNYRWGYPQ